MTLKRRLGFWSVFCIASGAMISLGLFILPGPAFKISGAAIILAYALATLMVIPTLLSKAELATPMPKILLRRTQHGRTARDTREPARLRSAMTRHPASLRRSGIRHRSVLRRRPVAAT